MVNENTILCCSFAQKAGSFGCKIHNHAFRFFGLNYIYKSFSVKDIGAAVVSMRALGIRGAGVTMPFKKTALFHVDRVDPVVDAVKVTNTIVNDDGVLSAYNTDYFSVRQVCSVLDRSRSVTILGSGGMACTCHAAMSDLGFVNIRHVTRANWVDILGLRDVIVLNCTPVEVGVHGSNELLDCRVTTRTGQSLALWQAAYQFKLYTQSSADVNEIRDVMSRAEGVIR